MRPPVIRVENMIGIVMRMAGQYVDVLSAFVLRIQQREVNSLPALGAARRLVHAM